jgi:hypothetical protein
MRIVIAMLLLAAALPGIAAAPPAAPRQQAGATLSPRIVTMSGFRIDRSRVNADEWPALEGRLERQIEIVISAGVPDKVQAFFRTVPIEIHPEHNGNGGTYQQKKVTLPALPLPADRPVLLHELLHAYHHQVLGNAAPIRKAYQAARKSPQLGGRYSAAHLMDNDREYFAIVGSIFLFGRIQQPPFDCAAVASEQPEFLAFLASTFGPHECPGALRAPE